MNEVAARANPGTLIQLDQCPKCGGVWCDKWELFPVDPDEAPQLDVLDEALLASPVDYDPRALYCPRCTAPLRECRDPVLPAELLFDRCLRCEGIWLNRGELTSYKTHQKGIQQKNFGPDAIIRKIPEVYKDSGSWVIKGTGGMMAYPRTPGASAEEFEPALGPAVATILQTLLRAVFGI